MEVHDAIIVGAGPAGLATAACLGRRGIDYVCLERAEQVASTWRQHYERLHLHTVKDYSELPFHPWPTQTPTYPSRQQVVDYLASYADALGIRPRFRTNVRAAGWTGDRWRIETDDEIYVSRALVIAAGYNRVPHRPTWPGQANFRGTILHSSEYKNGSAFLGKRALVVGIGNSGGEIAIDLWESGAHTSIAVRSPVHVMPRDLGGTPAQLSGLLMSHLPPAVADRITLSILDRVVGDLSSYGLRRPTIGPMTQVLTKGRIPLIDVGTIELIKQEQIQVTPGIERFTDRAVVFTDGREAEVDVVVLATGYRAAIGDFLHGADAYLDSRGYPTAHGAEASAPGLYFIGYRNPPIGQLNDISRQAPRIAKQIQVNHV